MKVNTTTAKAIGLMIIVLFLLSSAGFLSAKEGEIYKTGLPELTEEELQWQNQHMLKVKKIKLNKIGLERVNQWRAKKGKGKIDKDEMDVAAVGNELEVVTGAAASVDTSSALPSADYPGDVDNSRLKYFPPIRSQGSLNSCGVFNGTYYAMTHMYAMANNLDAKTGGDSYRLSPKWTYNMVNGGGNNGTWYYWAYEIGQKHGAATWTEFPYDSDYRAWSLNPDTWEHSLYRRFDQYGMVVNTHLDGGIDQVKQMLVNGYILNIPTYIDSWVYQAIGDDPATSEDDAFAGKKCVSWVNGTSGYHAMTVVGYNDNIWVDINGNNAVDSGEKGAFRIANSWGTGWGEAGYAWMSYDALKNPSAVSGGPSTGRIYGWYPSRAHWVTARTGYEPKVIGKFTLNHARRDHLRMTLGVSDINKSVPSVTWIPEMIYNQGGAYAFNGTTSAVDGTFVLDFTDLLPYADGLSTWYLGVQDDTVGSEATLSTFTLIDVANGNQVVQSMDAPQTADGTEVYAGVDYDTTGNNISPTAVADASIYSGPAPLVVNFYGASSYDADGDIFSYDWDFGDGASQSDPQVTHTYDQPGMYTATLTVTDELGAIDTDSVSIEVVADPTRQVYVSDIQATPLVDETGTTTRVSVQILDNDQNPVGGANVTGHWSELVSGNVSGTTSASGIVEWVSPPTTQSGTITFTVDSVTASGYEYDASLNTRASVDITAEESSNQNPVAVIQADSLSGTAPWTIAFDGRGSYDPDGSLTRYEWRVDGSVASSGTSNTFTYDFSTTGTYAVSLKVEDNNGAVSTEDEVIVTIQSASESLLMHVEYITVTVQQRGVNSQGLAEVQILDEDENPVANAKVSGAWSGIVVKEDQIGTTDSDGIAAFTSPKTKTSGSFEFTVENVRADGYIYSPENNVMSWDFTDTP
ncbi:PKD domain-containing protein [Desulfobacter sp. UBA2225]|uniref:PKD domain-containing protein n=1 Tax=Desulfobacter sp. UBA2225 TaxID=1961413 RepID=UPI00257A907B|nr:PKD domain-containing protein [Desulfobacter sp. UBA2225]